MLLGFFSIVGCVVSRETTEDDYLNSDAPGVLARQFLLVQFDGIKLSKDEDDFSNSKSSLRMYGGKCVEKYIKFNDTNDVRDIKKVSICYNNQMLTISDENDSSISIHSSPLWKDGFLYNVNNTNIGFNNISIKINSYERSDDE